MRYSEAEECYLIIAGQRRFTAATEAGLTEIPCWVQTPKDQDILLHQIVENWQRSDLNPFELADSLATLRDANSYSQRQLAEVTGKSKSEISKVLRILEVDPDVQKIAREESGGRLTARHLYSLGRLKPDQQGRALQRILEEGLGAIDTERLVGRIESRSSASGKSGAPVSRRRFVTKHGTAQFTFRKREVDPEDILAVLREVKSQLTEQAGDPADRQ